jgi:transcriptional regulator
MYLPKHFEETRVEEMHALMRQHPLATLVTLGPDGLNGNPLPLRLSAEPGPFGVLRGHVARANPVWKTFDPSVPALAVFSGPNVYVSPNWYPSKHVDGKAVPTWNYSCAHAHGRLRVIEDPAWLRELLAELTDRHESASFNPWRLDDAPAEYIDKMLGAVVGIEIAIERLEGKWKVSQNQSASNRAGVAAGLAAQDHAAAQQVAELVRERMA